MKHIFGPVPSRRLGASLGIDLIPYKTCSYDCVYCQLGGTTNKTVERKEYILRDSVITELKSLLSSLESPRQAIDYITFSGSGEPTLNSEIGSLLKEFKAITDIPLAVLTNGSLLFQEAVREVLSNADLVVPSLDAVTEEVFQKVNKPHPSLTVEKIIDGIKEFSRSFDGETWLEIMLVKGINDGQEEIERMAEVAAEMKLAKIQLNTVIRPPSEKIALPLNEEEMQQVKEKLGEKAEIIAYFDRKKERIYKGDVENEILAMLQRRPCTIPDISNALSLHINEVIKYIEQMQKNNSVKSITRRDGLYYQAIK
ncbi:TPA: radical SAM protein [Candidatus Poribacteria bacterium]|nr:radical SAM protein [Candidatus Poribacteria bacterium]